MSGDREDTASHTKFILFFLVLALLFGSLFLFDASLTGFVTGSRSLSSLAINQTYVVDSLNNSISLPVDFPLSSVLVSGQVKGQGGVAIILFNETHEWVVYSHNFSGSSSSQLTGLVTGGAVVGEDDVLGTNATNESLNDSFNDSLNESLDLADDATFNNTLNASFNQTSTDTGNQTLHETIVKLANETLNESFNESFNLSRNETFTEILNESNNESVNTTSDDLFNQSLNQTSNQTSTQPVNETIAETTNQTLNQTSNQTSTQPLNETIDETTNQTLNQTNNTTTSDDGRDTDVVNETINQSINDSDIVANPINETSSLNEIVATQSFTSACEETCSLPGVHATNIRVEVSGSAEVVIDAVHYEVKKPFEQKKFIPHQTLVVGTPVEIDLHEYFDFSEDIIFDTPTVPELDASVRDNRYLSLSSDVVGDFWLLVYATDGMGLQRSNTFHVRSVPNEYMEQVIAEDGEMVDLSSRVAKSFLNNSRVANLEDGIELMRKADPKAIRELDTKDTVRVTIRTEQLPKIIKVADGDAMFTSVAVGERTAKVDMRTLSPQEAKVKYARDDLQNSLLFDVNNDTALPVKTITGSFVTLEISADQLEELLLTDAVDKIHLDEELSVLTTEVIEMTGIDELQSQGLTGEGMKICVLDTGLNPSAIGLVDGVNAFGYNFVDDTADYEDVHGHGTTITYPMVQALPDATFYMGKIIDDDGIGYASTLLAGLDWCQEQGADVVSISAGGGKYTGYCDGLPAADKIKDLINSNLLSPTFTVTATGNDGYDDAVHFPACASRAIRVAASTKDDALWSDSNYHDATMIVAPGTQIASVNHLGNSVSVTGTSIAVPFVTAAVAQLYQNITTNLSISSLKNRLIQTGVVIDHDDRNFSRLFVADALISIITNNLTEGDVGIDTSEGLVITPSGGSPCTLLNSVSTCNNYGCCEWNSGLSSCMGVLGCPGRCWGEIFHPDGITCGICDGFTRECNDVSAGYVCVDGQLSQLSSSSNRCNTQNSCSANSCSGTQYYAGCDGSGNCQMNCASNPSHCASQTIYASSGGKVLSSSCTDISVTSTYNCGTWYSAGTGSCNYTRIYRGCTGTGFCSTTGSNGDTTSVNIPPGYVSKFYSGPEQSGAYQIPTSSVKCGATRYYGTDNACTYQARYPGCGFGDCYSDTSQYYGSATLNVPPDGYVGNTYAGTTESSAYQDVSSTYKCATLFMSTAGDCDYTIRYRGCTGSGICSILGSNALDSWTPIPPGFVATTYNNSVPSGAYQIPTSSVKCDATRYYASAGSCQYQARYPGCDGSGDCVSNTASNYASANLHVPDDRLTITQSGGSTLPYTSSPSPCNVAWRIILVLRVVLILRGIVVMLWVLVFVLVLLLMMVIIVLVLVLVLLVVVVGLWVVMLPVLLVVVMILMKMCAM